MDRALVARRCRAGRWLAVGRYRLSSAVQLLRRVEAMERECRARQVGLGPVREEKRGGSDGWWLAVWSTPDEVGDLEAERGIEAEGLEKIWEGIVLASRSLPLLFLTSRRSTIGANSSVPPGRARTAVPVPRSRSPGASGVSGLPDRHFGSEDGARGAIECVVSSSRRAPTVKKFHGARWNRPGGLQSTSWPRSAQASRARSTSRSRTRR